MIKNIYENEVGYMVGTFYADVFGYEIEVWFEKDISIEYVEKNIKNLNNLDIPIIKLGGDCAWSGDEGVTIAAKNNQLLYVGPFYDFNVWSSKLDVMFNYAA